MRGSDLAITAAALSRRFVINLNGAKQRIPMTAQLDAAYYQTQIDLAHDRVLMFEAKIMSYGDTWPPYKDCTQEAIDRDKLLIEKYQQMIDRL